MAEPRFCIEYAKSGRSICRECDETIPINSCRVGKVTPNVFSHGRAATLWYHHRCAFASCTCLWAGTKVVESPADLDGFTNLKDNEKEEVKKLIKSEV